MLPIKSQQDKAIECLNFHLRFSFLKLYRVSLSMYGSNQRILSHRVDSLVCNLIELKALDKKSIYLILMNLFLLYVTVKFSIIGLVQIKHDLLMIKIWPKTRTTEKCINQNETNTSIDESTIDYLNYIKLERFLNHLGSPLTTLNGINSASLLLAALTLVCLFFYGQTEIHSIRPKLDIKDFIINRSKERDKFRLSMKSIAEYYFYPNEIVTTVDRYSSKRTYYEYSIKVGLLLIEQTQSNDDQYKIKLSSSYLLNKESSASSRVLMKLTDYRQDRQESFISKIRLEDSFEPDHLNENWRSGVCYVLEKIHNIRFVIIILPGIIYLILVIIMEQSGRLDYRLELIECQMLNLTSSRVHLIELILKDLGSQDELDLYRNYNGTLKEYLQLSMMEFRLYMNARVFLTIIEIYAEILVALISYFLYFGLYLYYFTSNILWLRQILRLSKDCLMNLIDSIRYIDKLKYQPRQMNNINYLNHLIDEKQNESLRLLSLAYLNYELFRRSQGDYRKVTNFLIGQTALIFIPSLIITYLSCMYVNANDSTFSVVILSYISIYVNVFLITSAIRTNKILQLMKLTHRILAFCSEIHIRDRKIIHLWFKQLLTHHEALNYFAPEFFSISITFDKIVNLNAYLFILLYVFFMI